MELSEILRVAKAQIESLQSEKDALRESLIFLCRIKDHKEEYGKDKLYMDAQPAAWDQARKVIKETKD